MHLIRTVGQAQRALSGVPVGQREIVGDPRTVPLVASALDTVNGVLYADLPAAETGMAADQRVRRILPVHSLLVTPVFGRDICSVPASQSMSCSCKPITSPAPRP